MRILLFISLILSATSLFASVESRLPNQHLAYYGAEFYKNFPAKINKELLFRVLNGTHESTPSGYDNIGTCKKNCYSHTAVGYQAARKILFGELHIENDRRGVFVEDVYCGKKFYFRHVTDISNMGREVNIEHTWPQSKFNGRFNKELQKSDMHHLYPTDSDANNRRGNHHFGQVSEQEDQLDLNDCESSRLGRSNGKTIFSPPAEHRGNVARALFYFATRYQLDIIPSEEAILRQWHKNDPVDEEERERHEAIAKYQHVRNPFVDYPELVDNVTNL